MSEQTENFDEHLRSLLELMAQDGVQRAAEGFSGMEANFWMIPDPATLEVFSRQRLSDGR